MQVWGTIDAESHKGSEIELDDPPFSDFVGILALGVFDHTSDALRRLVDC